MKRNVEKQIKEYKTLFAYGKPGASIPIGASFYVSEYYQIKELSQGDLFTAIDNALMFAFMVGMKYGQKQSKGGKA